MTEHQMPPTVCSPGPAISALARGPGAWLRVIGPGAVIASLTIGSGELIFSTRAGAVFGYDLLWFFGAVLMLKWVLVYTTGRQMILTGVHPLQQWRQLPGPCGWLPVALLLLGLVAFPIWVSFHAGTVGTLLSWLTGTEQSLGGSVHYLWGVVVLALVLAGALCGGYSALERAQMAIVAVMLVAVLVSVLLLHPPWLALLRGLLVPQWPAYPGWAAIHPEFVRRPVWVELATYIGVIGGSAYDYLAYTSYLRDKGWGQAAQGPASPSFLAEMAARPDHPCRGWLRVLWVDCTLSFAAVFIFAAVFVTCGAMILAPQHRFPSGMNLLGLQAEFVTLYPWMKPLYFTGALLAMTGTLYGTIEVAPAVFREILAALGWARERDAARWRRWAVLWPGIGGLLILAASFGYLQSGMGKSLPGLVSLLTPANLFTGVLACGVICWLNPWSEKRLLPKALRMGLALKALNWTAAALFLAAGCKAYWDHSQWKSLAILAGTIVLAAAAARLLQGRASDRL